MNIKGTRAVERINLPFIFKNTQSVSALKDIPYNLVAPNVVYSLQQTITSSSFYFNWFVANTNFDQFLKDPSDIECICGNSNFKDSYHGQIFIGDPRMIKDNKIRNTFTIISNYYEPRKINRD